MLGFSAFKILLICCFLAPAGKEEVKAEAVAEPVAGEDYSMYWLLGLAVVLLVVVKVLRDVKSSLVEVEASVWIVYLLWIHLFVYYTPISTGFARGGAAWA